MMRKVVTSSDIKNALGLRGFFGTCAAKALYGICGLGEINRLFDGAADYQGREFADHLLENMNVTFDLNEEQLNNIPKTGGFIVVSNHPFGGIEGVMLYSLVSKVRPDIKLMANFILSHIPNLKEAFFAVNPFSENPEWKSSVAGIRGAIEHVAAGNGLGIFPAGEVSRYHGHDYPEDLPWSNSTARIIKQSKVPVIPIYWHGRNSKTFYFLDKIDSMLGTARLMRELANKHDTCIPVQIGKPILPGEIAEYEQPRDLAAYLRSRTYALEANLVKPEAPKNEQMEPIALHKDVSLLQEELDKIREQSLLFSSANFDCFLTEYDMIPNLMEEIARLREESFRAIGEGTGKSLDCDEFDHHYKHLILWDRVKHRIAGSYRLGIGSQIVPEYGFKGFYISTLFNLVDDTFLDSLQKTIELGRSFVSVEYQKEVLPLVMLLRGLSMVVVRYPDIEYFIGPVSISNWYPKFYQSLIFEYVTRNHPVKVEWTNLILPRMPFKADFLRVDPEVLLAHNMQNIDRFDKLLVRVSDGAYRMPTLFKKYLKLNAKLLCFNIDPEFNDVLDGLLFLKFTDFPEDEVMPLFRDGTEEEKQLVRARFGYL